MSGAVFHPAPTEQLDPRVNAFRPDLAAEALRGKVEAAQFVAGERYQVRGVSAPVRREPRDHAELQTEALHGEMATVYEVKDGWAWGQLAGDHYVGYIPFGLLSNDAVVPTFRVTALATFIYSEPDFKSLPLASLSLGSTISAVTENDRYLRLQTGGYVVARHVAELDRQQRDWVEVAERFLGVPYLWGGKTRLGIDCSGLVQVSLEATGAVCPRDSDMQARQLAPDLLVPDDLEGLERGDLICWRGHVGIVSDAYTLVHANAHHMSVVAEPLQSAVERIARDGSAIIGIKRLGRGGLQA